MSKYVVSLTAQGPVQASVVIEANSADEAGDLAVRRWHELEWEVADAPSKNDIDTTCVDDWAEVTR